MNFLLQFSLLLLLSRVAESISLSQSSMNGGIDGLIAMSLGDDSPHFPIPFHAHASFPS